MVPADAVTLPDGRTLRYRTYGDEDGPVLLFHHGTPGSSVLGDLLADAARERGVRVLAPSRPGCGGSDPVADPENWSWPADCVALADALGLDSVAVAGFSGGGPPALRVAAALPDRVTAVGVVGSPVPASDAGPFGALVGTPRLLGLAFRASEVLARLRSPAFVVDQLTDEAVEESVAATVARDFHAALRSGASGAVRESRRLARDWRLPTPDAEVTVWHGTRDDNVAVDAVRDAWEQRDGASLVTVEADHLGSLLAVREEVVGLALAG